MATQILPQSKTAQSHARKAPAAAHIGLQIEGDECPRWYPIDAERADALRLLLDCGDEWITLHTLNNRALLIHAPAVQQIVIQDAGTGNPSGDCYSPAVYHGLWGYCLAGDAEFVDPAVRAGVCSIVQAQGLDQVALAMMFRLYTLHYRTGAAMVKMLPADGRGAGRVFDAAGQDDRVALLDMPLQLVGPAAYRPVVQWLAFGRRGQLAQAA